MARTNASYKFIEEGETVAEASLRFLQQQMAPSIGGGRRVDVEASRTVGRVSLSNMVETTSGIILEPWQHHMTDRLQKLTYQRGQRILMHGPPQHGKSIIVSQRLPAYLIGDDPACRVRIACYNIEQATKFTKINKEVMLSPEYISMFPDEDCRIPNNASDKVFSTKARRAQRDAQASLVALGLQTGFVGNGADVLIIDDPYASSMDAASPVIREKTWAFWTSNAKVRITEETNVIIMFHRYREDDFAGQLILEEGLQSQNGVWELISYRAQWDGDERPEVGGLDPVGRSVGAYLSRRLARQSGYYPERKKNPLDWNSLFQGKPSNAEGNFFLISRMQVITFCPVTFIAVVRAWDIAASADKGDWTVGVKMGLGTDGLVYVIDVIRVRLETAARNALIRLTADLDRVLHPNIKIRMPQDPAAAGKDNVVHFTKLLIGHVVKFVLVAGSGDKERRAQPWSDYVNKGMVRLVCRASFGTDNYWPTAYIQEHRVFPGSNINDQIDASADCFSELALTPNIPKGQDFDTMGFDEEDITKGYQTVALAEDSQDSEASMLAEVAAQESSSEYSSDAEQGVVFGAGSDHEGVVINGSIYFLKDKTGKEGKRIAYAGTAAARKNVNKVTLRSNKLKRSNYYRPEGSPK